MNKEQQEPLVLTGNRARVRTLTLNRPRQLNAFNDALYDAFADALKEAASDRDVSVVIVTGSGRGFCAGQDLGEMAEPVSHSDGRPHGFQPFMDVLQSFPKPLIAAVNGIGVGIGLTMLPHCDLVLIAKNARLRAPFVSLGVTAEAASSYLLPRVIGRANTAQLLYTASWLSSEEAVNAGLAWRCVEDGDLMNEAFALADEIGAMPLSSLVATKRLLLDSRLEGIRHARKLENQAFEKLQGGPANREAIAAFNERRPADFSRIGFGADD